MLRPSGEPAFLMQGSLLNSLGCLGHTLKEEAVFSKKNVCLKGQRAEGTQSLLHLHLAGKGTLPPSRSDRFTDQSVISILRT